MKDFLSQVVEKKTFVESLFLVRVSGRVPPCIILSLRRFFDTSSEKNTHTTKDLEIARLHFAELTNDIAKFLPGAELGIWQASRTRWDSDMNSRDGIYPGSPTTIFYRMVSEAPLS